MQQTNAKKQMQQTNPTNKFNKQMQKNKCKKQIQQTNATN